jgi:hypothetical protein
VYVANASTVRVHISQGIRDNHALMHTFGTVQVDG